MLVHTINSEHQPLLCLKIKCKFIAPSLFITIFQYLFTVYPLLHFVNVPYFWSLRLLRLPRSEEYWDGMVCRKRKMILG